MSKFKKCSACGAQLEISYKFCPYCGKNISEDKEINNSEISKKVSYKQSKIKQTKKFSATKLLYIIILLVIIGGVLIYSSGIFDEPKIDFTKSQMPDDEIHRGINLQNIQKINALEEELKANPQDISKLLTLAHLLNDSGFKERAIEKYKEYLKTDPKNSDVLVDMGVCYFDLGKYEEALKYMKEALIYQPKHQIAHLNIGIVLLTSGKRDEALTWWKKAVDLNPNNEIGKRAQELIKSH